jgi:3-oxoacyl-[acyl-carrier protein] reductase
MRISDLSVLVTGASRGIGRAVAIELLRGGAKVTATARSAADLETLALEARALPGRLATHAGDLRQRVTCDAAVRTAVEIFGGLQVLVNNAGVGHRAPLEETTDEDWERVLATNLTAVFQLTRAALPHLKRQGGHIFMISSLAGSNPIAGMSAYCASKAALDQLAACLMLEVRQQGIKVTTLAPGSVDTSFGGRQAGSADWMLQPTDLARAIIDLLGSADHAHLSRVELRPLKPAPRS